MNELLDIEKIKQLKARYFRALDTNNWELFASTMSPNCLGKYSDGELSFANRTEIVNFMKDNLSGENMLTMHQGHHPEIEITSENTAHGVWYLEDTVVALESATRIYGTAIYDDRYSKIDGEWVISQIGYKRIFECAEPIAKEHAVLKSMFRK